MNIAKSIFLSAVKCSRTPRYIILCSPLLQALICFHWGTSVISSAPRLSMAPESFLVLILIGRFLLDIHLWTIFRKRPELVWARREILLPTYQLFFCCATLYVLERAGLPVITLIKPASVLLFFFLSTTGYLAPASYNLAFGKIKRLRQ